MLQVRYEFSHVFHQQHFSVVADSCQTIRVDAGQAAADRRPASDELDCVGARDFSTSQV